MAIDVAEAIANTPQSDPPFCFLGGPLYSGTADLAMEQNLLIQR